MARRTHSEQWWAKAAPHILRCTARYKDGSPCRREAVDGATVCGQHGGAAPQVQAAAAVRIQMTADDAARRLVEWMNDDNVEMRERVKIAQDMLDRGGLGAASKLLVGVVTDDPVERLFAAILSDPNGLTAEQVHPPPPPFDAAQAAIDAREDGPDLDEFLALGAGAGQAEDVVEGELVNDELPPHTVRVNGTMSDRPPKRLQDDLERTAVLRRAGLW